VVTPPAPLPMNVRQRMEAAFRTSFADVRVHVGPLASSIGALAFTHGSHIHFAPASNTQKNTTKGSFRIKGTAYFYATNSSPTNLGFTAGAVATAGGLYSRSTIPNNLPNATSGPVICTVDVTWDSTWHSNQDDIYSQVTIS
jgi:hypothetical protein